MQTCFRSQSWENPAEEDLSADCVLPLTSARVLGHGVYRYLQRTGSTNDDARALAAAGAPHGSLVVAEEQTAGRGRHERQWVSPPGSGIYVTLLLRPGILPAEQIPLMTLIAGLAGVEAVGKAADEVPVIKWPNDLLLNGFKIAGILTEATLGEVDPYVLVGMGMNVNTPAEALPPRLLYPASSLREELGRSVSRAALLAAWLERFEHWEACLAQGGRDRILQRWMQYSGMRGRDIIVTGMPGDVQGRVEGLAPEGALLIRTADGRLVPVHSGDVRLPEARIHQLKSCMQISVE